MDNLGITKNDLKIHKDHLKKIRSEELRQFSGGMSYMDTPHFVFHATGISGGELSWGLPTALGVTVPAPSIAGSEISLPEGVWAGTLNFKGIATDIGFRQRYRVIVTADPDLSNEDPLIKIPYDIPSPGAGQVGIAEDALRAPLEIPALISDGSMTLKVEYEPSAGTGTLVLDTDTTLTLQMLTPLTGSEPTTQVIEGPKWYNMVTGDLEEGYTRTPDHYPDLYPLAYTIDDPGIERWGAGGIALRGSSIIPAGASLPYKVADRPPVLGQPNPTPPTNQSWPDKRMWKDTDADGFADVSEFTTLEWHTDGSWWIIADLDWDGLTSVPGADDYWTWWSSVTIKII